MADSYRIGTGLTRARTARAARPSSERPPAYHFQGCSRDRDATGPAAAWNYCTRAATVLASALFGACCGRLTAAAVPHPSPGAFTVSPSFLRE